MGYKVDYGAMQSLLGAYSATLGEWSQGVSSVMNAEAMLESSPHISGNSADRMKEYLNTAYSCLSASLSSLLGLFNQNFLLYTEAYQQQIDAADNTCIEEAEQSERRNELQLKRTTVQQIGLAAEKVVSKVSDLVQVSSLDISEPDASLGQILTFMDDLDMGINSLEGAHVSGDFGEIDALITNIEAYLKDLIAISRDSKITFTQDSFLAIPSVPALIYAIYDAGDRMTAQEPEVAVAAQHLEERLERQRAEMEAREKKAKWAKTAVAIVAVVATGVAVATGVGTLLVPVIAGVSKYAFNAAADEYVKYGWDTDQWDRANIGKEAIKGWFSGFTSGILPPGTGNVVKASVSSANSALWGGLDNVYDQLTTTGELSNVKSVFFDAAKSGSSSFASAMVSDVVSDKVKDMPIGLGLDKYTNPSNEVRHYVGTFIESGTEKVATGITERFTSTTVETTFDVGRNIAEGKDTLDSIDLGDRYSKVGSFEDLGKDFVTGGIKGTTTAYFKERTPDPKTGLTPIIQAKLGYESDPETGKTPIIQEALSHMTDEKGLHDILGEMEERNPSTGANRMDMGSTAAGPDETPDFSRTSLTTSEEGIVREMEQNGEFNVAPSEYGPASYSSSKPPLTSDPIRIEFTAKTERYSEDSFVSQLSGQEEGLNQTTVADALDNMERYMDYGRADSSDIQSNYRYATIETIMDERGDEAISAMMQKDPNLTYEQASRQVNWGAIRQDAETELKGTDALHDPDQNAGGDPTNIHSIGSSSVNRSIGSQWGHGRVEELYEKIKEASAGMSRNEMENTRLNIRLDYSVKK